MLQTPPNNPTIGAPWLQRLGLAALLSICAGVLLTLSTCSPKPSWQAGLGAVDTLRVALTESETTYYLLGEEPTGFEYDLVKSFADDHELLLKPIVVADNHAALDALQNGQADMAVGIATSAQRDDWVKFTPVYATSKLDVVYNPKRDKPEKLADLDGDLTLAADGAIAQSLMLAWPNLNFATQTGVTQDNLIEQVAAGKLRSTIADTDLVAIMQRYYPKLRVAFTLPDTRRYLAWAFPKKHNAALYSRAEQWLQRKSTEELVHIIKQRYFSHTKRLGFVDNQIFTNQIRTQLPKWRQYFEREAKAQSLDWRLLAAVSYQESHWNPYAVSPTGVRGLMMLTLNTAKELGVTNRLDPQQSIRGGAEYIANQYQRLPDEIQEPDRTWLALAAYNVGFNHLMDARHLLKQRDRNPDLWINVSEALAWLTQDEYLPETRYGYARGHQAIHYVDNIRAYYDLLVWHFGIKTATEDLAQAEEDAASNAELPDYSATQRDENSPINITSHAL